MKSVGITDVGKKRSMNQDSIFYTDEAVGPVQNLYIVADGMGGHKAGEIASKIAIDTITNKFESIESLGKKEDAIEWMRNTVQDINHKIFEYTDKNQESKGMGTTLVIAIKTDDYILYGNIGDSSGFVIKNEQLHKVTKDHTLVNLLVSTGELTEEEAKYHPRKNVLMRALGANNPIDIDIFDVDTSVKGLFLCSDGLTNMLTNEQIEKVLNSKLSIEEVVLKLINKANMRGGHDNISIAYLKKESGEI